MKIGDGLSFSRKKLTVKRLRTLVHSFCTPVAVFKKHVETSAFKSMQQKLNDTINFTHFCNVNANVMSFLSLTPITQWVWELKLTKIFRFFLKNLRNLNNFPCYALLQRIFFKSCLCGPDFRLRLEIILLF